MDGWKQWFVLLLPVCAQAHSKEIAVKTMRRQSDVTPVCMSENFGLILLVTCRISTERHGEEACHLTYMHDKPFDRECDSRFFLINENRTVFIHLTSLTPVDSGNYSCECSYQRGTHVTHLTLTVEDEEKSTVSVSKLISTSVICVAMAFIITAAIMCGFTLWRNCQRENARSGSSELTTSRTHTVFDPDDLYANLHQPSSDVYQTISSVHHDEAEADTTNIYATI